MTSPAPRKICLHEEIALSKLTLRPHKDARASGASGSQTSGKSAAGKPSGTAVYGKPAAGPQRKPRRTPHPGLGGERHFFRKEVNAQGQVHTVSSRAEPRAPERSQWRITPARPHTSSWNSSQSDLTAGRFWSPHQPA